MTSKPSNTIQKQPYNKYNVRPFAFSYLAFFLFIYLNSQWFKKWTGFIFIFFFGTTTYSQLEMGDRVVKDLPYSYLIVEDSSLELDDVLKLDSFKAQRKNHGLEASNTYWFRIDFENELDTLQTQELWRLRTNYFSEATLYFQSGPLVQNNTIGQIQKNEDKKSIMYLNGILFGKENLISGRYLYIKAKMYFSHPSPVGFGYLSNTSNRFYTDYYTQNDLDKLIPSYSYFGACCILSLTFIVIFINIRKMEFLYYPMYVLFSGIYLTGLNIPALETFLTTKEGFWISLISQVLINLFYVLFAKYYLNTNKKYPLLNGAINIIITTLVVLILAHFTAYFLGFYRTQEIILNIQRVVMTLFGLLSMIYLLFKTKDILAIFIVVGSFLYMSGALAFWFTPNKYYMMGGSMLEFIIFSLGLAYKIKLEYEGKVALQKEVSLKEISAKRAQINPHFFFNSLSSIQNLMLDNNKSRALNYLGKFSKIARNVLESSYETTVTLTEEIELLRSYLELESLRFDNAFTYSIVIEEGINSDCVYIPLMLIQPFAENAIIHGLVGKKEGEKTVEIRFKKNGEYIVIEVEDNGIGRQSIEPLTKKKKSRGMEITKKRLKMIDASNQKKNTIEIVDKYDSKSQPRGTTVIIRLYNP